MRKYIDADRLEKDGWSMVRIRPASPTEMIYETKKPTDFPAANVAEVRRGKYVMNERGVYECSVCGRVPTQEQKQYDRYCPNCGALMINEDEEMSKVSEMEMAYGEYLNG